MKKLYARQVPAEHVDYDNYLNEEVLKEKNIWIGENRNYKTINAELVEPVERALNHAYDAYYEESAALDEGEELQEETLVSIVRDFFKDYELTDDEALKIMKLAAKFAEYQGEQIDTMCEVLDILKHDDFRNCELRGSVQREWIYCIYPTSVSAEELNYIEAVYFGTGTEWEITEGLLESAEEFDEAETFSEYTDLYRDEDVKAWVLDEAGYPNDGHIEVVLLKITGQHTYTNYDYEEV